MSKRDFYEVLGVSKTASQEEIRKAYKKLARKFHPDVKPADPDAEKKFSEITEAYDVLSDEEKRKNFDQFGHGFRGAGPGGPRGHRYEQRQPDRPAGHLHPRRRFAAGAGRRVVCQGRGAATGRSGSTRRAA